MAEFFNMGGYAGYVWPAYGVSALALIGLGVYVISRGRSARRRLDAALNAKSIDPSNNAPRPTTDAAAASDSDAA